ncbi:uncharacterized protein TEOVI_000320000 [Trypanosoma equiperdum]|uniref:Uncharacterized protein n=3 Tax=Trypanozoon TaxID=39700 RepID=Q38B41_TRYB2|nr:hypothetical protein, conserved [Trypanosoma brucei brucei TREU927]EAN77979.1 hypothetical protein, conserved [Trypanosoma brucei brucei TREU927]RHW69887.1 hypothetical protein DPX39_100061600 [Trypanosoma brucei equiperdum]SCU71619.1 hypothetical protein, conserved [Trypanosoma equiperdum]
MDDGVEAKPLCLTREQIDKQVERLSRRPEQRTLPDPFPVCPTVRMSKEQLEQVTKRVFYHYSEKHAEALRLAEERREKECGVASTVLSASDVDDIVKRLYYEGMERVKVGRKEASDRLLFKSTKVLPVISLKRFVNDMYLRGLEREKKKEEKLYEKYILPTEIPNLRISKSQAAESAVRLSRRHE